MSPVQTVAPSPAAAHDPSATTLKDRLIETVDRLAPAWKEISLRIHAHPELGRQERLASAWLSEALEQAGFSVRRGVAELPTSFVASKDSSAEAPIVGFVAEYDALPDLGHGCGHNLIAAAACLAGHALSLTSGTRVRVIGAPDEESFGGKAQLLEHGVFDGLCVAMMAHGGPFNLPSRDMVGARWITVEFHGKSAHAASGAEQGINALDALLMVFHGVGLVRQQLRPRARLDGVITHGGKAPNVVPDYVKGEFCVRAIQQDHLDRLCDRFAALARAAAEATGARLELKPARNSYLAMRRNSALEDAYARNLRRLGVEVHTYPADGSLGSTDFGNVSQAVPGIHAYFRMVPREVKHHTPGFVAASCSEVGLAGMVSAAKAMALTGLDVTLREDLRQAVRRDFSGA